MAAPARPADNLPSGTVTFLFTDVEGSTRLWAADRGAMSASLLVHDALVRDSIESNAGYVFTTAGDSFAAAFERASDALSAASSVQAALADAVWPGPALGVRMGLHLGEAEERGGDYFGPVVNTTARVESAGHGGQILLTEAVRSAAGASDVTDLGKHKLRDVADHVQVYQLGAEHFPALRVVDEAQSNLPVRPTRLIGRDIEIAKVRELMETSRLVTITAVGGSGKTRVAIAVGEAILPLRRGGVWLVDLTAVLDDDDVAAAIAGTLGLTLVSGDPVAQVVAHLVDTDALIILDNCEHVLDGCADFAEPFLATAGEASILATSREALNIDGERTVILEPLSSEGVDSHGVQLFVDRATAVAPNFRLDESNAALVATICSRLDGMPLAIELAAARVSVLKPADLLTGLEDRFVLLSGGRRRQRQRMLEATLDWSYDLLTPDEQQAFRALGVFVDGFDFEAVAAVIDSGRPAALDVIEKLAAKSLVVRADRGANTRFRLLETLKAYAENRMVDAGEAKDVRNRHLHHFRDLAMVRGRNAGSPLSTGIRLRYDLSNISSATAWATSTEQWVVGGELLEGSSAAFSLELRQHEYLELVDGAMPLCRRVDPALAETLEAASLSALYALDEIPRAMATAKRLTGSTSPLSRATGWVNTSPTSATTMISAQTDLDEALRSEPGPGISSVTQVFEGLWAMSALKAGDDTTALGHAVEAVAIADRDDAWCLLTVAFARLAATLQTQAGDPMQALKTIERLDRYNLRHHDGSNERALAHLAAGNTQQAVHFAKRCARRGAAGQIETETNLGLVLMAHFAHAEDDDAIAVELLLAAGPLLITDRASARVLADQLGVAANYHERLRRSVLPNTGHEQGPQGRESPRHTLQAELARRGWD